MSFKQLAQGRPCIQLPSSNNDLGVAFNPVDQCRCDCLGHSVARFFDKCDTVAWEKPLRLNGIAKQSSKAVCNVLTGTR